MSAIEASSVGIRTMVDGTLRLTVDIEPRNAQAAFALFGSPGVPMALAALKPASSKPEKEPAARTTGPICQWLVMRCKEAPFREWLRLSGDFKDELDEATAADVVRGWCHVSSRSEIDGDPRAEALFERHIRKPWLAHTRQKEHA